MQVNIATLSAGNTVKKRHTNQALTRSNTKKLLQLPELCGPIVKI